MKILMIDNYDSFTYNLVHYLEDVPQVAEVLVRTPDELSQVRLEDISGVIISPGPSHPADRREVMDFIESCWSSHPILGICLGHQMLWHMAGGMVGRGVRPVHGHVSEITHDGQGLFAGLPDVFAVTRYHSLVCSGEVPHGFTVSARTADGVVMAIRHLDYPIYGLQYHPEAILSEYGREQLGRFISFLKEGEMDAGPCKV
ncbi:anthranilate synthase component II [Salinicoccus roseus]|uniref:anthranilate synthase component II n=1 Tax=Salinicoccus roseus TaxID=45670 RepID=UPI0035656A92